MADRTPRYDRRARSSRDGERRLPDRRAPATPADSRSRARTAPAPLRCPQAGIPGTSPLPPVAAGSVRPVARPRNKRQRHTTSKQLSASYSLLTDDQELKSSGDASRIFETSVYVLSAHGSGAHAPDQGKATPSSRPLATRSATGILRGMLVTAADRNEIRARSGRRYRRSR